MLWFKKKKKLEQSKKYITLSVKEAEYFANDLLRAAREAKDHGWIYPVELCANFKKIAEISVNPFKKEAVTLFETLDDEVNDETNIDKKLKKAIDRL